MRLSSWLGVVLAAVAGLALGCAEEVKDVDRIQPHYIEKSLLADGDWYYRQTVVEVAPHIAVGFQGIEGGLEKIRWQITEDHLIAYRTHEVVPGLDANESLEGRVFRGDPVATFDIDTHFDIIREFNTSTGEQTNVLVEDTSLKPWYEREYMRVDWSSNGIEGPVDFGGFFAAVAQKNDWTRETEYFNPDRLVIEDDYIQATTEYFMPGYFENCWYYYGPTFSNYRGQCGAGVIKVRQAFAKIDLEDAKQFEPIEYFDRELLEDEQGNNIKYTTVAVGEDARHMVDVACTSEVLQDLAPDVTLEDCRDLQWDDFNRFGYFRTERQIYDRLIGAGYDATRRYYANHHNIWKKVRDDSGDTIPVGERELRPIVYHLNTNFPEDLKATAVEMVADWNQAFMEAAMAATGLSADEIGDQLERDYDASGEKSVWIDGDKLGPRALFQIRDNTCSVAGIEAYLQRNPKIQSVVDEATNGGGLLPGNLENVCSGLSYFSRELADERFEWEQIGDVRKSFVYWVNEDQPSGPLGYGPSSADPENGRILSGNAYVYGNAIDSYARSTADTIRALNGDLDLDELLDGRSYLEWIDNGTTVADRGVEITPALRRLIDERLGGQDFGGYRPFRDGRGGFDPAAMMRHMRDRVQAPRATDPMAPALLGPQNLGRHVLDTIRQDPVLREKMIDEEMLAAVRPLFGASPSDPVTDEMKDLAIDLAVDRNALQARFEERNRFFAEKNVFLADFIDDQMIGLALELKNKDPEEVYLHLRSAIFRGVTLHEIGHTVGLRHNFKGSFDALNYHDDFWKILSDHPDDEETWNEQKAPEYKYSSIMDYGSRPNSDIHGLGKYDHAAIKFVYGGHVEAFDDDVDVPGRLDVLLEMIDYKTLPELLGGHDKLTSRHDVSADDAMAERATGVVRNAQLFHENPDRSVGDYWSSKIVPFHFCSDEFNGDLWCRTWDDGGNHTEAVKSAIQRYWNYYLFNSYRRGRGEISFINGYFGRQGRLSQYITYPWKYYTFYHAYNTGETRAAGYGLPDDLLEAAMIGLNFVNQVMGTPEPGTYCLNDDLNVFIPNYFGGVDPASCTRVDIPVGMGRNQFIDFDDDYHYRVNYLGSYYDKTAFIFDLFDNFTRFWRLSDYTDDRQYTIGFYNTFRPEIMGMLGDLMQSTFGYYGNFSFYNRVDGNSVVANNLVAAPEGQNELPRIWTSMPRNMIWYAALYGAALHTNSYDGTTDFIEYITLHETGSGEDRLYEDGADAVEFENPLTGQIYRAVQTDDGLSIAYRLVELGNRTIDEWKRAQLAMGADPANAALRESFDLADRNLQDYAELMDDFRLLRGVFDYER